MLTSGLEYLEEINKASIQSENPPDLYIISNDSLEKAFLAGLASPLEEEGWSEIKEEYPDAARLAVTYKNKTVGYPFYFETSSLLYNRTYLEDFARSLIEAERDAAEGEAAMAELEENGPLEEGESGEGDAPEDGDMPDIDAEPETGADDEAGMQELVAERVREILPSTIDDILNFANEYNAPEQVEAIFKWDVTDIFYNYFFAGNYMIVGGAAGDNTANMNIYNKDAIECLKVYQDLNQFFSIDTKEISYDKILDDFIAGKIVYTVATTDAVAKLEEAKENGSFAYDYSIALVPDINEELLTRSLSVTNCVVVNGYSDKQEAAEDFARFLTCEYTDTLYARTGKVAARYGVDYGNNNLQEFVNEYEISVPVPKMVGIQKIPVLLRFFPAFLRFPAQFFLIQIFDLFHGFFLFFYHRFRIRFSRYLGHNLFRKLPQPVVGVGSVPYLCKRYFQFHPEIARLHHLRHRYGYFIFVHKFLQIVIPIIH